MTIDELNIAWSEAAQIDDQKTMEWLQVQAREMGTVEGTATADQIEGSLAFSAGRFSDALECFQKCISGWTQLAKPVFVANAQISIGSVFVQLSNYPEALQYYEQALEWCVECGNARGEAVAKANIASVCHIVGDYPGALRRYEEAAGIFSASGNELQHATNIGNIGLVYKEMGDNIKALEYFRRQEQLALKIGNSKLAFKALRFIASVHESEQQYEVALAERERCLEWFKTTGDAIAIRDTQLQVSSTLLLLERVAEAEHIVMEALALPQFNAVNHAGFLMNHARILFTKSEYDSARTIALEALEIARSVSHRISENDAQLLLRDVAQRGNNLSAYIEHNNEVQRITEETKGVARTREIVKLEMDKQNAEQQKEREKERALLFGTLPKSVAERKLRGEDVSSDHFADAAVLFADVVGFTSHTSNMPASDVVQLLARIFTSFDKHCDDNNVVKVKTMGDSYMCFKADASTTENANALASVAIAMQHEQFIWPDNTPIQFRIGIHIGSATAGVIGTDRLQYDVWGDTVNVASRMESTCEPGKIHITEQFANALSDERRQEATSSNEKQREATSGDTKRREVGTWHLAHGTWHLAHRGETELKGKGSMHTYWLTTPTH